MASRQRFRGQRNRCLEAMQVRRRSKMTAGVNHCGRDARDRACVDRDEAGGSGLECRGDVFVFLRFAGARGVNQPPTGCDDVGGMAQHPALRFGERGKILLATAPADVGVAAQRAEA